MPKKVIITKFEQPRECLKKVLPLHRLFSYYAAYREILEDFPSTVEVQHAKSAWKKEPWNLERQ